jgi:hypothetical protein
MLVQDVNPPLTERMRRAIEAHVMNLEPAFGSGTFLVGFQSLETNM